MKILLAHSDPKLAARESIDLWRIIRPFNELKKHVDWQIDEIPYLLDESKLDKDNQYPTDELVKLAEKYGQYDIIWTGYFVDATLYDLMSFVQMKYGTKFIVDIDDDFYHLPKHNNFWTDPYGGYKGLKEVHWMIENSDYVVTSTKNLKTELDKHCRGKTYILPNYIGKDFKHKLFDNGDKVVISYFASITHKKDISETGFLEALQQIVHKYKNVHVGTVGASIDAYLPKGRYTHHRGIAGKKYITDLWPNINADISVAPLEDNQFNRCKSNIKWFESAYIPSAFVASNIEPYKGSVEEGKTGLLVNNDSESWYEALESLVINKQLRQTIAKNAQAKVKKDWDISTNWEVLKGIVEDVAKS